MTKRSDAEYSKIRLPVGKTFYGRINGYKQIFEVMENDLEKRYKSTDKLIIKVYSFYSDKEIDLDLEKIENLAACPDMQISTIHIPNLETVNVFDLILKDKELREVHDVFKFIREENSHLESIIKTNLTTYYWLPKLNTPLLNTSCFTNVKIGSMDQGVFIDYFSKELLNLLSNISGTSFSNSVHRRVAINLRKFMNVKSEIDCEIIEGAAIVEAYRNGPESCMKTSTAVEFYAKHPEVIKLVKFINIKTGAYFGRGLLWFMENGKVYIDRIYTSSFSAEACLQAFDEYATAHDIEVESCYAGQTPISAKFKSARPSVNTIKFVLDPEQDLKAPPYFDTLKYPVKASMDCWISRYKYLYGAATTDEFREKQKWENIEPNVKKWISQMAPELVAVDNLVQIQHPSSTEINTSSNPQGYTRTTYGIIPAIVNRKNLDIMNHTRVLEAVLTDIANFQGA